MRVSVTDPDRHDSVILEDGRRLAWAEFGAASGRPVLFCTGAGMSGWLGFGQPCLGEFDIRLLAVDRPGLGASTPHPSKTFDSWVADIRQLAAARHLGKFGVVGFSQGAPFALALAAAGLTSAVALVSGQDELAHPGLAPLLIPDMLAMVRRAQSDPDGFQEFFESIATAEELQKLIVNLSGEVDRAVYLAPNFLPALERSLREGFAQGPSGYARDLRISLQMWPFDVLAIDVPVDLWYGGRDSSPGHSPDFGATLSRCLPQSTRVVDPGHGGSILWTRASDILAKIVVPPGASRRAGRGGNPDRRCPLIRKHNWCSTALPRCGPSRSKR